MSDTDRFESGIGWLIAGLGPVLVAGALVPLREETGNSNVALALVVVVVLAAVTGGTMAGGVAAVVSALSFDFFHTVPYQSLTIDSQDDLETTVLLLVVGLVVGTLAARARREHASAESGRTGLRRIHRVAEMAATGEVPSTVIEAAQDELADLMGLSTCRFESGAHPGALPRMERSGVIAGQREYRFGHGGMELPAEGVELAVLAGGSQIGRFVMVPGPDRGVSLDQRVVAVAISDQVGGAVAGHRLRQVPAPEATTTPGAPVGTKQHPDRRSGTTTMTTDVPASIEGDDGFERATRLEDTDG